jgi:hypothetical protein
MSAEMLRKLTIKNCGWTVANIKDAVSAVDEGERVDLLKVVGKTTAATSGQTPLGTFHQLIGDFFAINTATGETFKASKCILPNFIAETLTAALEKSPAVEFALLIGAKNKPDSMTGYEFTVQPLIETKPSESVLSLLSAAGIDPDAPKPERLPAPAPAKKAAAK